MEACRTALPALLGHQERQENGLTVVMGKCHLMIGPAPSMLPPDADVLAGFWW
jgi:hypothetical protein